MKANISRKIASKIFLAILGLLLWGVFVIVPMTDRIFGNVQNELFKKLLEFLFIAIFAATPFAILLWKIISNEVIKPILEMKEITKILATGNLEKRLPIRSGDEIAELSENINKIINNLLSSLQSMIKSLRETHEKENQLQENISQLEDAKLQIQQSADELQLEKNKLQDANTKNEAILSSIGEAVIAIDQNKNIFLFNHVASLITGIAPEHAVGRPYNECLKIVTEKEGEPVNLIDKIFAGNPNQERIRLAITNTQNQKIPIAESTALIKNSKQEVQGVVLAFRDMTRERQLDRMKDEFVSVASHELRTPMTAIKGMLSMILEGDYGGVNVELKEPLDDIFKSANRLIDLVNDMLDVSRIEAGRIKISLTTFKINEVVKEIVDSLKPIALQKNITLNIGTQSEFTAQADINKIKQILSNLIGNSLKFTDQGGITVTSQLNYDLIKVYVSDTGLGISPEDQKKLFGKFEQITSKQAGKPPGTGLGLYISKQLCQIMGGDMWIEHSEDGNGSTFAFSVPVAGTAHAIKTAERIAKMMETQSHHIPGST